MEKECRIKCTLCRSRHRESFMYQLPDKTVCPDCCSEYKKIFYGYKNRDERKKEANEMYKSFEAGWIAEEQEKGLDHIEIPPFVKNHYKHIWKNEYFFNLNDPNLKKYVYDDIIQLPSKAEEEEKGLHHIEIPDWVRNHYQKLCKNESFYNLNDPIPNIKEQVYDDIIQLPHVYEISKILFDEEIFKKKLGESDGISEDK
jgi:hypothetical protein